MTSIFLNKISSIEVHYKSLPLLLVLGILALLGGAVFFTERSMQEPALVGIGAGVIFLIVYFASRRHVITIRSDGGAAIDFQTKGMKREAVLNFINQIETAKHNYNRL